MLFTERPVGGNGPVSLPSPSLGCSASPTLGAFSGANRRQQPKGQGGQKSWLRPAIGLAGGKLDPSVSRISRNFFCKLQFPSPGFPQSPLMKSEWSAGARRRALFFEYKFKWALFSTGAFRRENQEVAKGRPPPP